MVGWFFVGRFTVFKASSYKIRPFACRCYYTVPFCDTKSAKYGCSWASLQVMRAVGSYVRRRCLRREV